MVLKLQYAAQEQQVGLEARAATVAHDCVPLEHRACGHCSAWSPGLGAQDSEQAPHLGGDELED